MSLSLIWLLVGATLCLVELFVPTAFVLFVMGLSALAVALLATVIPSFGLQVFVWIVLSALTIAFSRRLTQQPTVPAMRDPIEAETLTEIPPNQAGRVLYKGNSWRACCDDRELMIPANQRVYVVGRQGNTLFVMPEHLLTALPESDNDRRWSQNASPLPAMDEPVANQESTEEG